MDADDAVFSWAIRRGSPGDEHAGALLGQRTRDAAPYAVRASGNNRHTVVEG
jgi:hypothetical protein